MASETQLATMEMMDSMKSFNSFESSNSVKVLEPTVAEIKTTTETVLSQQQDFDRRQLAERTFGFLDLPPEIRYEVYQYLFEAARLSVDPAQGYANGKYLASCGYSICACDFPWHIVNTCRQLRQECLPVLLASTTLEVSRNLERASSLPTVFLSSIPRAVVLDAKLFANQPIMLDQLQGLKTLELRNITVWCKFFDEVYLESEAADECMMNLALFNLRRISNALVALCTATRKFKLLLCCQYVVNSLSDETIHAVVDVDNKVILRKSRGPPMRDFHAWSGFY